MKEKNATLILFSFKITSVILMLILSFACNNNKDSTKTESKDTITTSVGPDTATAQKGPHGEVIKPFSERDDCFTLTKEQITPWLNDAGWNDPAQPDKFISAVIFYPYTDANGDAIILACPVVNKVWRTASTIEVTVKTLDPKCGFIANAQLRPNVYEDFVKYFKDIDTEQFNVIRLTPQPFKDPGSGVATMNFEFETSTKVGSGEYVVNRGLSKPSPPAPPMFKDMMNSLH